MNAIEILKHAMSMLTSNPKNTLRVFGIPVIFTILIGGVGFLIAFGGPSVVFDSRALNRFVAAGEISWAVIVLTSVLMAISSAWGAVAWHRYILLDELPTGFIPKLNFDRILGYIGTVFLIALFVIFVSIIISVLGALFSSFGKPIALFFGLIVGVLATVAWLGLSVLLPARAIKSSEGFYEALDETWVNFGRLLFLAFILFVIFGLPTILIESMRMSALKAILDALFNLVSGMISISVMTTLYCVWFDPSRLDRDLAK